MFIYLDEATAALRRILIYMVDEVDGYTPETGIAAPTVEISKNGAAQAAGSGSWSEIGDGLYYYQLTAGEVDIEGFSREFNKEVQVVTKLETKIDLIDTVVDAILVLVNELLDLGENKLTIDNSTSELHLWNDAGDAIIKTWDLTSYIGGAIALQGLGPANRSTRTL
jgi:hypothetical protein